MRLGLGNNPGIQLLAWFPNLKTLGPTDSWKETPQGETPRSKSFPPRTIHIISHPAQQRKFLFAFSAAEVYTQLRR